MPKINQEEYGYIGWKHPGSEETEVKKDIEWLKEKVKGEYEYNRAKHNKEGFEGYAHREFAFKYVLGLLDQLDEPEVLSQEWVKGHEQQVHPDHPSNAWWVPSDDLQDLFVPKQEEVDRAYKDGYEKGKKYTFYKGYLEGLAEGERKTNEYFESITEEPSQEQVWKYLSEHGIEVVDKEPETVASVIADFYKSLERLKEVLGIEVEELEE